MGFCAKRAAASTTTTGCADWSDGHRRAPPTAPRLEERKKAQSTRARFTLTFASLFQSLCLCRAPPPRRPSRRLLPASADTHTSRSPTSHHSSSRSRCYPPSSRSCRLLIATCAYFPAPHSSRHLAASPHSARAARHHVVLVVDARRVRRHLPAQNHRRPRHVHAAQAPVAPLRRALPQHPRPPLQGQRDRGRPVRRRLAADRRREPADVGGRLQVGPDCRRVHRHARRRAQLVGLHGRPRQPDCRLWRQHRALDRGRLPLRRWLRIRPAPVGADERNLWPPQRLHCHVLFPHHVAGRLDRLAQHCLGSRLPRARRVLRLEPARQRRRHHLGRSRRGSARLGHGLVRCVAFPRSCAWANYGRFHRRRCRVALGRGLPRHLLRRHHGTHHLPVGRDVRAAPAPPARRHALKGDWQGLPLPARRQAAAPRRPHVHGRADPALGVLGIRTHRPRPFHLCCHHLRYTLHGVCRLPDRVRGQPRMERGRGGPRVPRPRHRRHPLRRRRPHLGQPALPQGGQEARPRAARGPAPARHVGRRPRRHWPRRLCRHRLAQRALDRAHHLWHPVRPRHGRALPRCPCLPRRHVHHLRRVGAGRQLGSAVALRRRLPALHDVHVREPRRPLGGRAAGLPRARVPADAAPVLQVRRGDPRALQVRRGRAAHHGRHHGRAQGRGAGRRRKGRGQRRRRRRRTGAADDGRRRRHAGRPGRADGRARQGRRGRPRCGRARRAPAPVPPRLPRVGAGARRPPRLPRVGPVRDPRRPRRDRPRRRRAPPP